MLAHEFLTFQATLNKRGKAWRWCVCTIGGEALMRGSERSRPAARYSANRALFLLLLSSPYRLKQQSASASPRLFGHPRSVG
jgi:hypothetical protein